MNAGTGNIAAIGVLETVGIVLNSSSSQRSAHRCGCLGNTTVRGCGASESKTRRIEKVGFDLAAADATKTGIQVADPAARIVAWLLDAFIAAIVFSVFNPLLYQERPSTSLALALFAAMMLALVVYMALFDGGKRGATPGKRILGLRVVDSESGDPIGFRRAALRRLVYLGGGMCFYVGWLWIFTSAQRRAWHDLAAGTVVVRTR